MITYRICSLVIKNENIKSKTWNEALHKFYYKYYGKQRKGYKLIWNFIDMMSFGVELSTKGRKRFNKIKIEEISKNCLIYILQSEEQRGLIKNLRENGKIVDKKPSF